MSNNNLDIFNNFFSSNKHLLDKENNNWSADKILFQLAYEHAKDSPITKQAEKFLKDGGVDWPSFNQTNRQERYEEDPNIKTLNEHKSTITHAHLLEENIVLTSSWDGTMRIWNLDDDSSRILKGHTRRIIASKVLSKDIVYSISKDGTIRFWDINYGTSKKFVFSLAEACSNFIFHSQFKIYLTKPKQALIIINSHEKEIISGSFIVDLNNGTSKVFEDPHIDKCKFDHIHSIEKDKLLYLADKSLYLWDFKSNSRRIIKSYSYELGNIRQTKKNSVLFYSGSFFWVLNLCDKEPLYLINSDGKKRIHKPATYLKEYKHMFVAESKEIIKAWLLTESKVLVLYEDNEFRLYDLNNETKKVYSGFKINGRLESKKDLTDLDLFFENKFLDSIGGRLFKGKSQEEVNKYLNSRKEWEFTDQLKSNKIICYSKQSKEGNNLRILDLSKGIWKTLAHQGEVFGAFFTDKNTIISWGKDNIIRLWNLENGLSKVFQAHTASIIGVTLLNKHMAISWGYDGTLRVWDLRKGKSSINDGHSNKILGINLLEETYALTNSNDSTLRLWNIADGTSKVFKGHRAIVNQAVFINSSYFLSSSFDGTLRLWNIYDGLSKVFKGHQQFIYGFHILKDNKILSWGWDQTIRIWDLNDAFLSFKDPTALPWRECTIENNHLDDLLDCIPERIIFNGHNGSVSGTELLGDNQFLSWSVDGTMMLWDLKYIRMKFKNELWQVKRSPLRVFNEHEAAILGVKVINNNSVLSYSTDSTLRLWNIVDGTSKVFKGHKAEVKGVHLLGAKKILSWSSDSTLRLWNLVDGTSKVFKGHTDVVIGVKVISDNYILSYSMDKTIRLWDLNSKKHLVSYLDEISTPIHIINNSCISVSTDTIYVHDIRNLNLKTKYICPGISHTSISFLSQAENIIIFTSKGEYKHIDLSKIIL